MVEYNFFLLKPDGVSDMIREEISEKCGHKLIRVDNEESIELSEKQIDALYPKYNEVHRPFTVNMLRGYLANKKLAFIRVEGSDSIFEDCLRIKKEIRKQYGDYLYHNVLHCPQDLEEHNYQISILEDDFGLRSKEKGSVLEHDYQFWCGLNRLDIQNAIDSFWHEWKGVHEDIIASPNSKYRAYLFCELSWNCTWEDVIKGLLKAAKVNEPVIPKLIVDSLRSFYSPNGLALSKDLYSMRVIQNYFHLIKGAHCWLVG